MKKLFFLYTLMFKVSLILSDEYRYPIENLDDETILIMHQKSLDDLELLSYNIKTDSSQKLLSSLYLPSYVKVIPGNKKYSFIDRGRVYIKDFLKRTPRILDVHQPIYDIQSLQWISDHECIFSAKYKKNYKLFMYDVDNEGGTLYALSKLDDGINYIFPSSVDKDLFCITHQEEAEVYGIAKIAWNPVPFDQVCQNQEQNVFIENIFIENKNSLCFLNTKNCDFGYVIEIIEHDHNTQVLRFGCCTVDLKKEEIVRLFEFKIPEKFIIGMEENRFFESLYPLLPFYGTDEIYFTNYDNTSNKLTLYIYDKESKEVSLYPINKSLHDKNIFAPFVVNDQLFFGQSIN